jgi:hypothetical protein
MKPEIIDKYLSRLKDYDGLITTDHLSGWGLPKGLAPDHLTGKRYFDFKLGQEARRLRDKDWCTHITSSTASGDIFSKTLSGRLSHSKIIEICNKADALNDITANITDWATGKTKTRHIGY